jgi:hypothetical protein
MNKADSSRPELVMKTVTPAEAANCSTREEWARLFITRNPDAHALQVIGAYNGTDLGDRLGYFTVTAA